MVEDFLFSFVSSIFTKAFGKNLRNILYIYLIGIILSYI